jgi:hypothetical protein
MWCTAVTESSRQASRWLVPAHKSGRERVSESKRRKSIGFTGELTTDNRVFIVSQGVVCECQATVSMKRLKIVCSVECGDGGKEIIEMRAAYRYNSACLFSLRLPTEF